MPAQWYTGNAIIFQDPMGLPATDDTRKHEKLWFQFSQNEVMIKTNMVYDESNLENEKNNTVRRMF